MTKLKLKQRKTHLSLGAYNLQNQILKEVIEN